MAFEINKYPKIAVIQPTCAWLNTPFSFPVSTIRDKWIYRKSWVLQAGKLVYLLGPSCGTGESSWIPLELILNDTIKYSLVKRWAKVDYSQYLPYIYNEERYIELI